MAYYSVQTICWLIFCFLAHVWRERQLFRIADVPDDLATGGRESLQVNVQDLRRFIDGELLLSGNKLLASAARKAWLSILAPVPPLFR